MKSPTIHKLIGSSCFRRQRQRNVKSGNYKILQILDLLYMDEYSMMSAEIMSQLDKTLQIVRKTALFDELCEQDIEGEKLVMRNILENKFTLKILAMLSYFPRTFVIKILLNS